MTTKHGKLVWHVPVERDGEKFTWQVGEATYRKLRKLAAEMKEPVSISVKKPKYGMVPVRASDINFDYIYRPYVPLQFSPAFDWEPGPDFDFSKVMTRYAKKIVRQDYYGTLTIPEVIRDMEDPKPLQFETLTIEEDFYVPRRADEIDIDRVIGDAINRSTARIIADPSRYPHQCPRCSAPAYIGFMSVDCSRKSCC